MSLATFGLSEAKVGNWKRRKKKDGDELTEQQRVILVLLANGRTTKQIGDELCIGEATIETYRLRLLRHMKAKNSCQAVAFGFKRKILI